MRRVRFGVIGVGDFGETHVRVLQCMENAEVEAVCDIDEKRARKVAAEHNIKRYCTNYNELVQDKGIEAVTIATSEHMHLKPTLSAAQGGKHILLEKPFATSLEDADKMIEAVNDAGVFFMVGHVLRFDPRYAAVKERIESGQLGKIDTIYARRNTSRGAAAHYMKKTYPLLDAGIHDIDLMLWYTQDRVERIYTEAASSLDLPYPNIMASILKFKRGAVGIVENFCNLPDRVAFPFNVDARMDVTGTKGSASLDFSRHSLSLCGEKGWENPDTYYWPEVHGRTVGDLRGEFEYFIGCILNGKKPELNNAQEARASLEVALAGVESLKLHKPIVLK